jgi:hypothetical protein
MAQGTLTHFEEFPKALGDKVHDLANDTFKIALITTLPTAADVTPSLGDYTEVSGAGYTPGGEALTVTWTEAGGVTDFKQTGGTITWTQNAGGPTNIIAGLIYNSTSVGNEAIAFVDFTADGGSTPISLVDKNVTWKPEATQNRIFTLS